MLRGVGAEVWDRLVEPTTVTDLVDGLGLPAERCGEVAELLESLVDADLVERI